MNSGIYSITIGSKSYVGLSTNIPQRIKDHTSKLMKGCHQNLHLQNAYNKHQSIKHYVLEYTSEWLGEKEVMWIDRLDTYNNGYNLTEGGEDPPRLFGKDHPQYGKKHSQTFIEKRVAAARGKKKPGTSVNMKVNNPMFKEENKAKFRGNQHGLRKDITMKEIQPLLDSGHNRNEIGRILGCSPHTIKSRINSL